MNYSLHSFHAPDEAQESHKIFRNVDGKCVGSVERSIKNYFLLYTY